MCTWYCFRENVKCQSIRERERERERERRERETDRQTEQTDRQTERWRVGEGKRRERAREVRRENAEDCRYGWSRKKIMELLRVSGRRELLKPLFEGTRRFLLHVCGKGKKL